MFDAETTAIITGASANIASYMLTGRLDALRDWIIRIFRHGTDDQRAEPLRILDADIEALTQRTISETDVRARWGVLLAAYLATHPDARADVSAMCSAPPLVKSINIGSQHNHGSGTLIGGDNYGHINPPAPQER